MSNWSNQYAFFLIFSFFLYFLKFFSVKLKKAICKVLVLFYVHTLQIAKWWYCSMYTLYKLQSGGIVQYSHFVKCEHRPIPALCSPPCVYTEKCSTAKSLVIFNNVFSMDLFSLRKNSSFLRKWLPKCEGIVRRIPMSSDIVSHNVSGILLTLWLTLWEDCEKIVSGDEYPYWLETSKDYSNPGGKA